MATELRLRGGTTAQHASFTGATKEITVDTTKNTVVVHDGATAGGVPLATESNLTSEVNSSVHAPGTGLPNEAGTAYASDVTTSPTDTTANRLLKVGDFGLGREAPSITDANLQPAGSMVRISSPWNNVPLAENGSLLSYGQGNFRPQFFVPNGNPRIYFRQRLGTVWTPWRQIYHTDNLFTSTTAPGSAPIYACRAWVNFNGTGTVAIRASGNVSSVTQNSGGDYTINFTTAMTDANYAALSLSGEASTADNQNWVSLVSRTSSLVRVRVSEHGKAAAWIPQNNNVGFLGISIFR